MFHTVVYSSTLCTFSNPLGATDSGWLGILSDETAIQHSLPWEIVPKISQIRCTVLYKSPHYINSIPYSWTSTTLTGRGTDVQRMYSMMVLQYWINETLRVNPTDCTAAVRTWKFN